MLLLLIFRNFKNPHGGAGVLKYSKKYHSKYFCTAFGSLMAIKIKLQNYKCMYPISHNIYRLLYDIIAM